MANSDYHDYAILIPGIGYSRLALVLLNAGYTNLVVTDIESKVIDYQKNLCHKFLKENYQKVEGEKVDNKKIQKISRLDLLIDNIFESNLEKEYGIIFDLILDISFLDVFIRNQGPKKTQPILLQLTNLLCPNFGLILSLSIHHPSWKYVSSKNNKNWNTLYGTISKILNESNDHRYEKRNRKTGIPRPIALLVHLPIWYKENREQFFTCFGAIKLKYLSEVTRNDMPVYSAENF